MRTKEGQVLHDKYVAAAAKILAANGYTRILVELPGKAKPPEINGYIPDIYAEKVVMLPGRIPITNIYLVEVETEDSKGTLNTLLQVLALQSWAMQNNATFKEVIAR